MNCLKVSSCKPSSSSAGALPCAVPQRVGCYRRSTLTKAPRKRTFIANMSKYNPSAMLASCTGVATRAQMYASGNAAQELCCYGIDNGNGNSGNGNGCKGFGGNGDDGSFNSNSAASLPVLFFALAAAVPLAIANILLQATPAVAAPRPAVPSFKSKPAGSGVAMLALPQATLVIPTTSSGSNSNGVNSTQMKKSAQGKSSSSSGKRASWYQYGRVQLSETERRYFAEAQYRVRELIRV